MTTLKILRTKCGYSQADMAKKLNISRQYYLLIEKGLRNPSTKLDRLIKQVGLELVDEYTEYCKDKALMQEFENRGDDEQTT